MALVAPVQMQEGLTLASPYIFWLIAVLSTCFTFYLLMKLGWMVLQLWSEHREENALIDALHLSTQQRALVMDARKAMSKKALWLALQPGQSSDSIRVSIVQVNNLYLGRALLYANVCEAYLQAYVGDAALGSFFHIVCDTEAAEIVARNAGGVEIDPMDEFHRFSFQGFVGDYVDCLDCEILTLSEVVGVEELAI